MDRRASRKVTHRRSLRAIVVALAVLAAGTTASGAGQGTALAAPTRPGAGSARSVVADGWDVTSPESMGMDSTVLSGARDYAFQPDRHTQGVVVVRGGKVVSEWYAPGEGPQSWAASWSMAKSFTSALIGIAISEGKIPNVDVSMATYFPDWAGTPKALITLRDVLHMESGLKWDEDYDPANLTASDVIQMGLTPDELSYAASRPAEVDPGTRWSYSSGDTMLLSHVIEVATGMSAADYARQKLFDPIGMSQVEWWKDAAGHTLTYCCLDTTSRDFARFGLLYLHDGNWDGQQVVPSSWVHDSLDPTSNSGGVYGFQWWISSAPGVQGPIYMANGHDGQFIYVIPSLDMVVVRNGDYGKSECAPVADPNLFGPYPANGLVDGAGTRPPASWSHSSFLAPIVASVTGPEPGGSATLVPGHEPQPTSRNPGGEAMVPCRADTTPTTTPGSTTPGTNGTGTAPTGTARPATPVRGRPAYTG